MRFATVETSRSNEIWLKTTTNPDSYSEVICGFTETLKDVSYELLRHFERCRTEITDVTTQIFSLTQCNLEISSLVSDINHFYILFGSILWARVVINHGFCTSFLLNSMFHCYQNQFPLKTNYHQLFST